MRRVLVASKTCRAAMPASELAGRFAAAGLDADFAPISDRADTLDRYEAIVVGTELVGEDVLSRGSSLRLVQKFGVGLDAIDQDAAARHGVAVRNLPAANSGAVAEMAFALMISLARRVVEGDRGTRSGAWPRLLGTSLRGKTLGIVGTGAIGSQLARLSSGFSMRVLGYDVVENDGFREAGGTYVPLCELLGQSDFVSLHVPLIESTRHMVGADELHCMKPTAFLVNTARGGLVDEAALYRALEEGAIAGAALDVLEHEPPDESPLLRLGNVVCTPHIAAYDRETLEGMVRRCIESVSEFFSSGEGGDTRC